MGCILVATDGSEGAERAVDYAATLAKEAGSDLLVVNVIGGLGLPGDVFRQFTRAQHAWLEELLETESANALRDARERALKLGAPSVHLESARGDVARTILELADARQAEAIVVGKRGAGQVAGALLGSVSQKLVSLAGRVVIVVP
ncbi:Nucleotide-binding universal stress protein, UspA family [Tistlia consotensis]|uniref:Nucleotide-binding universal stress protein, UspA family n=1 Tax=Tistlia consotensis USBA 355 TaxID=560819 RepID=A0A1Y6BC77_9PROT|nr:universal stress protein [Tistlia consotensis]SME96602.1 Nucleotide-binding universal stress protein, UspA family [Tistlia consotensis USBA 355]SNR55934.1 Nucleotide-binding universal stress protein, UspA family [Tistlia consotensis]